MINKITINQINKKLDEDHITIIEPIVDLHKRVKCKDSNGYIIFINPNNYLYRHSIGKKIDISNTYSIDNINHFLKLHNVDFVCISHKYKNAHELLSFKCNRCQDQISAKWVNIQKAENCKNASRRFLVCPNCDGRLESLHALILKQVFIHEYPDTVIEDRTFRNPRTKFICPTDIVNHRLKIAIEIQSQWHDMKDTQIKDLEKKEFWINKGYEFYDLDIRDYTILEMCQIFFNVEEIPNYINYSYANKINIKKIQDLLNNGLTIKEIAKQEDINMHRIYDAIYANKLYYPENYKKTNKKAVGQFTLDGEFIKTYSAIKYAAKDNNICPSVLTLRLLNNNPICNGCMWKYM